MSKIKDFIIPYESLILIQMVIYMYSYNFHSLWLICDLVIIFNILYLINQHSLRHYKITFLIFIILFLYLLYHQLGNLYLINFLSFWDNYKHLFVFIFAFYMYKKISIERKEIFLNRLYKMSIVSFFIQIFFIFIEYNLGWGWDYLAGTFGDGSTHSVAYFSVFLTLFMIRFKKSIPLTVTVIALSIITNLLSENTGYFVILVIMVFFIFLEKINITNLILIGVIAIFMASIIARNEMASYATNKITKFSLVKEYSGSKNVRAERGILMGYALFLGGKYGQGFGAYSNIYNVDGWLFPKLIDKQLCISEGTHLVAEIGIVGLLLTLLLFITLFVKILPDGKSRLYCITYFVLAMFHGRLLIDERLFFFFTLNFLIWYASHENKEATTNTLKIY